MPQFDISTYISQIFWLSICLGFLIIFSLNYTLPILREKFEKREKLINDNRQEALQLQKQASEIQKNFENHLNEVKKKAFQTYIQAKNDIEINLSIQKKEIKEQFKKDLENYTLNIYKIHDKTLNHLNPYLVHLTNKILYQLPLIKLSNSSDQKKLIQKSLNTMRSKGN